MSKATPDTKIKGKGLDEFRAAHDRNFIVPQKIRAGLAQLGESWVYEVEFMRLAGLSTTDLAAFREEFADFYVEIKARNSKRAWAGTKKFAQALRDKLA